MSDKKKCRGCRLIKPLEEYNSYDSKPNVKKALCKGCDQQARRDTARREKLDIANSRDTVLFWDESWVYA